MRGAAVQERPHSLCFHHLITPTHRPLPPLNEDGPAGATREVWLCARAVRSHAWSKLLFAPVFTREGCCATAAQVPVQLMLQARLQSARLRSADDMALARACALARTMQTYC